MVELEGFPYWEISFDEDGKRLTAKSLADEVATAGVRDLWIFSHGWNNQPEAAQRLYRRFLEQCRLVLTRTTVHIDQQPGFVGLIWPSTLMPDEALPGDETGGGAASLDDPYERLKLLFGTDEDIGGLVEGLDETNAGTFRDFLKPLLKAPAKSIPAEDRGMDDFLKRLTADPAERGECRRCRAVDLRARGVPQAAR